MVRQVILRQGDDIALPAANSPPSSPTALTGEKKSKKRKIGKNGAPIKRTTHLLSCNCSADSDCARVRANEPYRKEVQQYINNARLEHKKRFGKGAHLAVKEIHKHHMHPPPERTNSAIRQAVIRNYNKSFPPPANAANAAANRDGHDEHCNLNHCRKCDTYDHSYGAKCPKYKKDFEKEASKRTLMGWKYSLPMSNEHGFCRPVMVCVVMYLCVMGLSAASKSNLIKEYWADRQSALEHEETWRGSGGHNR